MECPSTKRSKPNYKVCGHCHKELSLKIYKEHKRLYYKAVKKSWVEDNNNDEEGSDQSSSGFSSLDEFNVSVDGSIENVESTKHQDHHDSDDSDVCGKNH